MRENKRALRGVKPLCAVIAALLLSACSLDYGEQVNASAQVPELTFRNSTYSRYQDGKLSVRLEADTLEQYKGTQGSFAGNAHFLTWSDSGELETEGTCALLGINSSTEIYTMFSNILLKNYKQNMEIKAQNLKWNGKTEQLTSGKTDTVFLHRDNMELYGTGFSASGVSQTFSFDAPVSGTIETASDTEQNQQYED